MKVSISLSAEDLGALDRYARQAGLASRSAAVQAAIRRLPDAEIENDYAQAWDEWAKGDGGRWESVVGDGLADAPR
ncbi:ribbon-helix-helix domain-containing protein [Serinicoccus marinus]|uniref:ribbon-helix-helix domain-containing protein n=1 Tax=Serinicoccus marinus TaxID=247333 RepID=UPI0003B51765|nr:ribbon-helix-helix domain-containing protein [Serinicoccus marinus]